MAGIYFHIPFCKQACHYCDFHFSTNTSIQPLLVEAMVREVQLRQDYLQAEPVETVYFGGGTPSLLKTKELASLMMTVNATHTLIRGAEITLEANPDDITPERLQSWRSAGINRLSIGIQSFEDSVLQYLNRSHDAQAALRSVDLARASGFDNFSIDMIYAIPGMSSQDWEKNLALATRLEPPHISAYTLTIEEKTAFGKWVARGKMRPVDEVAAAEQLEMVMEILSSAGYHQYEISNFARPGFESRHNSSYWSGAKYLGIGPSAHSFDKVSRQFNLANNHLYVRALNENRVPAEKEVLSRRDHINEYILTTLRTATGSNVCYLKHELGYDLLSERAEYLLQLQDRGMIKVGDTFVSLTTQGKLLADKITADLFCSSDE